MKKLFAAFATGLIIASAVPVMAAEDNTADRRDIRPGYCWQAADSQSGDGYYCEGGYCRRGQARGGWADTQRR